MSLGLTINGIDGFLSGNWTLHANAKVIDDETLELNTTGNFQETIATINVLPNQSYTINVIGNGYFWLDSYDANSIKTNIFGTQLFSTKTFITRADSKTIKIGLTNNLDTGTFTFKRPMLNLGSIPAPYEKKRGDRMVLPVVKKNLFDSDDFMSAKWANTASTKSLVNGECELVGSQSLSKIFYQSNLYYTVSASNKSFVGSVDVFSTTGGTVRISLFSWGSPDHFSDYITINANEWTRISYMYSFPQLESGNVGLAIECGNKTIKIKNPQIEEGTVATPYEPYTVQINQKSARRTSTDSGVLSAVQIKQSQSGLLFNGNTDYLQLPSMTMDSVEIDCLIDGSQDKMLIDTRNGLGSGWVSTLTTKGSGTTKVFINGVEGTIPFNIRSKIKIVYANQFMDDINIFSDYAGVVCPKGTIYKIICYLAGNIVAQYDFEKQNSDVSSVLRGNPTWLLKQAVR